MGDALAALVGAEQRPDEQNRRAGRAEQVREHGAEPQRPGVDERRPGEGALNVNPTCDHEERGNDDDEAQVFVELLV